MSTLQVTNVARVGPFLLIHGHKDTNLLKNLNENIQLYLPRLIEKAPVIQQLDPNQVYLAHNPRSNKYFRCTVIEQRHSDRVTVEFIDYGNEFDVSVGNLLALNLSLSEGKFLNTFPPIATKYILSNFQCKWQQNELEAIQKFINNSNLNIAHENTTNIFRLISLLYEGLEFVEKLKRERIGKYISSTEQNTLLLQIAEHQSSQSSSSVSQSSNSQALDIMRSSNYNPGRNLVPTRPLQSTATNRTSVQLIQNHLAPPKPQRALQVDVSDGRSSNDSRSTFSNPPVFIANELQIGSHHLVYCSYAQDGPHLFSIQLKRNEPVLDSIMSNLPDVELKNLTTKPSIGMACIARAKDKMLYRAAIVLIHHNVCRVSFVDFGHSEDVPHADIYEIPPKFLHHKTYSIQFSLSGCKQLEPVDDQLKEYFRGLVKDEELELKVMPLDGPVYVQYCELYLRNRSVLELLRSKKTELNSYANAVRLVDDDIVIIRYVKTAKQFYVQRYIDYDAFETMMDRLLAHCHQSKSMTRMPRMGECCAAMLGVDNNEWYRVQVMEIIDQHRVVVQFVDFGFVAECELHQLKEITPKFLELPRQVTECCLVEFEKIDEVPENTNKQLEMLAENRERERRKFRVSLRERLPDSVFLVNLVDETESPALNVSSSLCKLLMPRKQYGNKAPPKSQSSADCTNTTISSDASTTLSSTSSNEPKWAGTTQSTPAHSGQYAKRAPAAAPNKLTWNNTNDSSIRMNKSREADGSEVRSTFTERSDEGRNSTRTSDDHRIAENGGGDRRNNSRNSNNWRADDNSGSGYENNNRKSGRRSTDTNKYEKSRSVESVTPEEFVGLNPALPETLIPLGAISKVKMITWLTPQLFYVQMKSYEEECDAMIERMQSFYAKRPAIAQQVPNGAIVVARQKSSNLLKRAKIVDYNTLLKKYRAKSIDSGESYVCLQGDLFELEKSFTKLPPLATGCRLIDVIRNHSREDILKAIDRYIEQSKSMSCEFIETIGDVTSVKFNLDGVDLKTKMIDEGHLTHLPTEIKLSRLVGQTIFIKPTSIKDLSCFRAQIYGCDITLMCSYKNLKALKTNPKLNAEFKQLENANLLVRVDSVTDDNVLVFDIFVPFLDGQKTDSSLEIPPYPIFKDNTVVQVSHVESVNEIYIQCVYHMANLSEFLERLYEFYSNGGIPYNAPVVSSLCAALSPEDGNYYRATVERIVSDNKVVVRYIDYGNCERVPLVNLKQLDPRFKQLNTFAIKMYLPVKLIVAKSDAMKELDRVTADRDFTLDIIDYYRNQWVIDLASHGFSLIASLREGGFTLPMNPTEHRNMIQQADQKPSTPVQEMPAIQPTASATAATTEVEPKPRGTAAFISHTDNPKRFYLQLVTEESALENFVRNLQIVAPSLPQLTDFRAGVECIAQYSLDGQWYRAKIIDTDGNITSVLFVDYGNTDTITSNSLLKTSNESFEAIKHFALPCALDIQPKNSSEWDQKACEKMLNISENLLHFEFISEDAALNYVKLYDGDRDIANELIQEGHAVPLQKIKNGEKCFASHVNSLEDFYIQMNSDSPALNLIEEFLSDVSKFDTLADYRAGTICIAKFEDDSYYRAQILEDTPRDAANVEVFFIDYGNTFRATDLRSLPRNIAELPHLRKRCALRKPDDIERWSEKAEVRFKEIVNMGATILTVRLVEPDEKAIIELFTDDRNIGTELAALCEKRVRLDSYVDEPEISTAPAPRFPCYITHINSVHDFYVNLVGKESDITAMTAALANADVLKHPLKPEEIKKKLICIARYDHDGRYYRAKVRDIVNGTSYRIIFIDYGNETEVTQLYQLPAELKGDALAIRCKLETTISSEKYLDRLKQLLILAGGDDENTFQAIEVIDKTCSPNVVKFFRDSVDISKLDMADHAADRIMNEMCTQIQRGEIAADNYLNDIVNDLPAK